MTRRCRASSVIVRLAVLGLALIVLPRDVAAQSFGVAYGASAAVAGEHVAVGEPNSVRRPGTVYMPAPDDRDASRKEAAEMVREASQEVETVLAYETATTGLEFTPSHFNDVRAEMVLKMEALAAYQAVGAPRVDLRPRMAQAYARYWGRFRDFTEVEAFELIRGSID